MRIDAYNAISQVYQTSVAKTAGKAKGKGALSDSLHISDAARDYQTAKSAVAAAPDVRQDKVAQIKAMMEKGTYSVSAEALAEKMLNQTKTLVF